MIWKIAEKIKFYLELHIKNIVLVFRMENGQQKEIYLKL